MTEGTVVTARVRTPIRGWEVWSLPPVLRAYVIAVVSAWGLALVAAPLLGTPSVRDGLVFVLLMACGALGVEATKRQGEPAGIASKDLYLPWMLPVALLLPPVLALVVAVPLLFMVQVRVKRAPLYRRVVTVAVMGLAMGLVSIGLHELPGAWGLGGVEPGWSSLAWAGLTLAGGLVFLVLNTVLMGFAVKASAPELTWREVMFLDQDESRLSDVGEICLGTILALLCLLTPLLAVVAFVPVMLMQRALLHDQLAAAARLDAKTGLLNGPSWEREVTSEIARANRTGSALSVMLLDLDHFKEVNDRFGHLAGDDILLGVAEAMKHQTREYDQIARFGGDEFAILLPQSDLMEAIRTAERIRRRVAAIAVPAGEHVVRTSVSIGVAELSSPDEGVTDLLARADLSLYRAKENRDQVHSALHEDLSFPRDL